MTSKHRAISSVAVFGGSQAMWPIATLLAAQLPRHIRLILVEESDARVDAEAISIPADCRFLQAIGFDAQMLVEQCNGTIGLAVELRGWLGEGGDLCVAPSGDLPTIEGLPVHQIMLRAAMMAGTPDRYAYLMQPFRFAARAAMAGKLADVPGDPQSPLTLLGPMVQYERGACAAQLAGRFQRGDTERRTGRPARVRVAEGESVVKTVWLDGGEELRADFLIDASGSLSALLPGGFDADFRPLPGWDRLQRAASVRIAEPRIGDRGHPVVRAIEGGLLVETPLGNGAVRNLLFDEDLLPEAQLAELVGERTDTHAFAARVSERPWIGNFARLGTASASFGPCFSADTRFLHEQVLQLARLLPARVSMQAEAERFNTEHGQIAAQIGAFLTLPLVLNRRDDALWRTLRDLDLPEHPAIRLEQFRSRGRFPTFDHELFDRQSWIELMIGMGIVPGRHDPRVAVLDMQRIRPTLKAMAGSFTDTIAAMPDRADYLRNFASDR